MTMIRIIPCLDVKGGRVVKGVNFQGLRDAGDPAELGERYCIEGADEVVFLDIAASGEGRGTMRGWTCRVAEVMTIPFTVGGGISSPEQAVELVRAGADKVSLNTAALRDPDLVRRCALALGSQAVVVAVDVKSSPLGFQVHACGGTEPTGISMVDWIRRVESLGAGEILLTSIDRDGTQEGFHLEALQAAREATDLPIIASGGAGRREHFLEAARAGADGLLAASVFHYGGIPIGDLKDFLSSHGIPVRRGVRA
ncbi:imidazoleglycerol phosphate synthase, cyclase subunit [Thermanaerovibrio acidaminovorans DSM 6589]|uniref:Imidazole glycerol phosphate synthase subunit HisF n=2 Tax=Thermanaerovibrio TaxID=81461 RepID=D1B859_THEAS|nr:imidazole glycerol phosphate synthase subunit HisF [Thermanaerovibrio acidaminovorans]ACZ18462.1 imidazoleglycerol phosphate synthase, cyclase subunit [Thermanaerovibrio acidaminovorans DSM 6589]